MNGAVIMVFLSVLMEVGPDLAMIALGVLAARVAPVRWMGLFDRVTYKFFFPVMLFVYASGRPVGLEELVHVGGLSWLVMLAGCAAGRLTRASGPEKEVDFAGVWQTIWRFNTALGFVAAQALSPGATAIIAVVAGAAVPLSNALAVFALARGDSASPAKLAWEVATNPFLLASAGGVAFGSLGFVFPPLVADGLRLTADTALPMTLLSVGLAIDPRAVLRVDRFSAMIHALKLVFSPVLVMALGLLLGAQGMTMAVILIFAALPTATASLVQAARYGADRALVAGIVAQSNVFGCVTLPLWISAAQLWAMG